jgi:hypothetical protein
MVENLLSIIYLAVLHQEKVSLDYLEMPPSALKNLFGCQQSPSNNGDV